MASMTMTVNVEGIPGMLQRVRTEFAQAVREIAAKETDGRVVSRLYEVAGLLAQDASAVEAQKALQSPQITGLPRLSQTMVRSGGKPPAGAENLRPGPEIKKP